MREWMREVDLGTWNGRKDAREGRGLERLLRRWSHIYQDAYRRAYGEERTRQIELEEGGEV